MAKTLLLEALHARFGDSLILHYGDVADPKRILIDGGPRDVYRDTLRKRISELREERNATVSGLQPSTPLPLRLIMVSHIDGDHITGILDLLNDSQYALLCKTTGFWHNSFNDIINGTDDKQELLPAVAALAEAASDDANPLAELWNDLIDSDGRAQAIVADVKQGRRLRDDVKKKGIPLNFEYGGKLIQTDTTIPGGKLLDMGQGMFFRVLGPSATRVSELQTEWNKKLASLSLNKAAGQQADPAALAETAAYLDKSVPNLSSIIVMAEFEGKRLLLTGDARGDDILLGLKEAGLLDSQGVIHIDLLKLPHHGSDRNVSTDFFRKVRANHYVVSADGTHDNPDTATLEMLSTARSDDNFMLYLTNSPPHVRTFIDKERAAGRKYGIVERAENALSVQVSL